MKRSEAILSLSEKLQKSQNLLDEYKNGSIDLKCLCDNLAIRAVDYCVDKIEMLPPETKATPEDFSNLGFTQDFLDEHDFSVNKWEPEDD